MPLVTTRISYVRLGGKISCYPHKKAIHFIGHCGDYCFFCIHFTNVRYNLIQLELPHNVWLSDCNLLICRHQHQSYHGPVLITITTLWENSLPAKSNGIHLYSHIACQAIPAGVEGDRHLWFRLHPFSFFSDWLEKHSWEIPFSKTWKNHLYTQLDEQQHIDTNLNLENLCANIDSIVDDDRLQHNDSAINFAHKTKSTIVQNLGKE